jgi:uncharacterized damage-inducible protein DinB
MTLNVGNSELQAIREWYAYNTFVRKRYLRFLRKLPRNIVSKDKGASYASILDIFTHVLDAYKLWLEGFYEIRENTKPLEHLSLKELANEEEELDAYLSKLLQRITPADLERSFEFILTEGKGKRKAKAILANVLWHLVGEDLQHRGEINALLYQENINPPITTWCDWPQNSRLTYQTNRNCTEP